MNFVPENLNELQNFEKNQENPLRSLNIGQAGKLNKITSDDLELLTFYTNAKGKGHEGVEMIFMRYLEKKNTPNILKKQKIFIKH